MALFLNCLMIAGARAVDVSLGTVRMVLTVRGKRIIGACIGFIEILIWFIVVREALTSSDTSFWIAISYALGFAIGTYAGSWIEEKLAIGNSSIQVITKGLRNDLVDQLRKNGFAVSSTVIEGREGKNLLLIIEVNRRKIDKVNYIINTIAPDSFITILDVNQVINGYL